MKDKFQLYGCQKKGAYHEGIRVDALSMALLIMIYPGIMCLILGLHDTLPSMKRQNGATVVKFAPSFCIVQNECSPFGVTLSSNRGKLSSEASKSAFLVEIKLKKEAKRKLQTIQGGGLM